MLPNRNYSFYSSCFFILLLIFNLSKAQLLENNKDLRPPESRSYAASQIKYPDTEGGEHAIVPFRETFKLTVIPESFIILISADNRYRLLVNGNYAAKVLAKSDPEHWCYETIDLVVFLRQEKNILAAEVARISLSDFCSKSHRQYGICSLSLGLGKAWL
jgi:hypothetical protein